MFKSLFVAIANFFGFAIAVTNAVEKGMDSEKVKEAKFEIKKETIEQDELDKKIRKRNKRVDEMFGDLEPHPEISVETKVRQEMYGSDEEEINLTIQMLTDRLNASAKYLRLKAKMNEVKPSKFRLFKKKKPESQ